MRYLRYEKIESIFCVIFRFPELNGNINNICIRNLGEKGIVIHRMKKIYNFT